MTNDLSRNVSHKAYNKLAELPDTVLGMMRVNGCATGGFKQDNEFFVSGRSVCLAYPVNKTFIPTHSCLNDG